MSSTDTKTDIRTSSYKFNTNLLKLSVSDELDEAKKEWEFITKLTKHDSKNLCICQHKVKHINYFLNRKNQNTIICGSKCCKKFNFETEEVKNKKLLQLLIKNLTKDEYEQINNILMYSDNIKQQLVKIYQNEFEINKTDINKLKRLLEEIEELIDYYKFECLLDLKNNILKKLCDAEISKLKCKKHVEKYQSKYDLYIKTNDTSKLKELLVEIEKKKKEKKLFTEEELARTQFYKELAITRHQNKCNGWASATGFKNCCTCPTGFKGAGAFCPVHRD
jgi:hypothetical protein